MELQVCGKKRLQKHLIKRRNSDVHQQWLLTTIAQQRLAFPNVERAREREKIGKKWREEIMEVRKVSNEKGQVERNMVRRNGKMEEKGGEARNSGSKLSNEEG